jgi:DNA polymerase-3 subunit alpha
MLAYLISRKHVPIKMKNHPGKKDDMYFGTWIDVKVTILIPRTFRTA